MKKLESCGHIFIKDYLSIKNLFDKIHEVLTVSIHTIKSGRCKLINQS